MLKTISALTTSVDAINQILDEDGCVVIRNLMSAEQLDELKNDLIKSLEATPMCKGVFYGQATKRMSSILLKSDIAVDLTLNSNMKAVMDRFFLGSCTQYQLNLTQAIQIFPNEPAQVIHADDLMFPFELANPGDQKMINCMWAIDDFTSKNGATNLVPGSHKWSRDRRPEAHEIVSAEMTAGSVLVYFGSLLHGGGANISDHPRLGLVISYCLGWLRQAENHYLAIPREKVASFPERLQRLLGYFVHEPNLGSVEGRDPIEVISSEQVSPQIFEEFLLEETKSLIKAYREAEQEKPTERNAA